jgi:hypothetical protein
MDWKVPFVIYRITPEGKLEEVFLAQDFKAATYWLTYIAQPGDVLCKTPLHKKHSQDSKKPEYWSHKGATRDPIANEQKWKEIVSDKHFLGEFPEEQVHEQL